MSRTVAHEKRDLDSNNKFFDMTCPKCAIKTIHQLLEAIDTVWIEEDTTGWESYQIIQCQDCQTFSFCKESQLSECHGAESDPDETFYPNFFDFYPERGDVQSSLTLPHKLPAIIEKVYNEVLYAFNARLFVIASIGIKTIIDEVCRDKKILKKASLLLKIEGLADAGHITVDSAKILHRLSVLGNNPTNKFATQDIKELRATIEVIDHLIKSVYVLPELAKDITSAA